MKSINVIKKLEEKQEIKQDMQRNKDKEKHNKSVYQFFDNYILPILNREFEELDETQLNYLKAKCIDIVNEMFLDFPSSENYEDYADLKRQIADLKNKKDIAEMLISFVLYRMSQNVEKYANDNGMSMEDYLQNIIDTEQ